MRLSSFRPKYFVRRLLQWQFERANPNAPWLNESAVRLLESWLRPTDSGIEWGSGRSTLWLAERVEKLLSIENDQSWYEQVTMKLSKAGLSHKVDYRYVPCTDEYSEQDGHDFVTVGEQWQDSMADFVLVDGFMRMCCTRIAMRKLRPGGLLVLDNANVFLPNPSLGTFSTVHLPRREPLTAQWAALHRELASWRAVLTTDRIWDTRFWIKPLPT